MTTSADEDCEAALHALGATSGEERSAARDRMARDPEFAADVARWDSRLATLSADIDPVLPPPALWDRISAAVDQVQRPPASMTIRGDEAQWEAIDLGVYKKRLHIDTAAGWETFLVKVDPGAVVAPHGHPMLEECFVLEGAIEIDGVSIRRGDLHLGFAGFDHAAIYSPSGALLYIRGAIDA
jgi:hypothetical protein